MATTARRSNSSRLMEAPSEPRGSPNPVVRADGRPDRRRSCLRNLALRPDREPTRHSTIMKISPAPNNYPSGTRPEAVGAGVQFATDPIHGMRTRDSLPALTMQNGTGTGSVAFTVRGWSWLGHAEHCKAGHGAVWRNVTPRNGDNFSGLDSTCLGWARQCSAGRGNNATRGDIAGQFLRVRRVTAGQALSGHANNASLARYPSAILRGEPGPGRAWSGETSTPPRAVSGEISRGPAKRVKPGRGRVRRGYTSPGTAIPDIFPSTKKHPHHAGQRSTG